MKAVIRISAMALTLVFLTLTLAQASSPNQIKAQMKQRLPALVELKSQGIIGETNRGYLAFVGSEKPQADVVAQENQDRKIIYTYIAKQQKVSLELVESRRAAKLAQQAKPGEYIQDQAGNWVKK